MPPETENESERRRRSGSVVSIVLWWQKFHFSGRVIMCSVLFGLGLVLIGGIIFAINMNDDDSKSGDEFLPSEMPSKPPSNVVGPVIMGIGGFIVTVGVIMCLFETQVCRKKKQTADSSPLISENPSDPERKDTKPEEVPSKTHNHGHGHHGHKHGARKGGASPKRYKHHQSKSRAKEKKASTPPISIDTSKSFMTSSEEKFLTPPNTLEHPPLAPRESREAGNQTSASLMKSFTSSGPSWTQSSEFQTPASSFRDSSVSLESSTEINENKKLKHAMPTELMINSGFMTPIMLEEEKTQKMATEIQNQKKAELKSSSELETNEHFSKTTDQANVLTFPESKIGIENEDLNLLETGNTDACDERNRSTIVKSNVIEDQSLVVTDVTSLDEPEEKQDSDFIITHDLLQVHDSKNTSDKGPEVIQETTADNEISNQILITVDEETKPEESALEGVSTSDVKEEPSLQHDDKEALLGDANQGDSHRDLESSTSSDETVVSEISVLEKPVNVMKSEENGSDTLNGNDDGTSNLTHSEENDAKDANIEEQETINSS